MVQEFQKSWGDALASVDEAVRILAQISLSPGGREFLNNLERGEAGLCAELLDRVRSYIPSYLASPTETIPQGLTRHSFDQPTRQSFLIVLTESVKRRRRLPDSIVITEKTMAEENVHTSGGFWDVRRGTLNNSAIAIKTPRITTTTDVEKIREVSWKFPFLLSMLLRYSV